MLDLNGGQLLLLLSLCYLKALSYLRRDQDDDDEKCIDGVYNCGMCNVQRYGS